MATTENKRISVAYDLFSVDEEGLHLRERATVEKPFVFITGFGVALKPFEEAVVGLDEYDTFDVTLQPDEAYGDYDEERVVSLDREMFFVEGRFDHERVRVNSYIPLVNDQGDRFLARVAEITDTAVVVDLNHPLAGETLEFRGTVIDTRPATEEEMQRLVRQLAGTGCEECEGCDDEDGEGCGGCGSRDE